MPYSLKNRSVLVIAGSRGLGAVIARKFAAEGANVAINYVSAKERGEAVAKECAEKYGVKTTVLQGDAGVTKDCERLVEETKKAFGGVDVIINNAAWTKYTPFGDLNALTEEEWDKTWAVNVKGNMTVLRAALPTFNENPEGGAYIVTSSVAATSIGGSSMAYTVTKAAQVHLIKCMAQTQGPKVRINAVLPGLLLTEWIAGFPDSFKNTAQEKAVLKRAVDLEDCADAFLMLAKNTSITGQIITVGMHARPPRYEINQLIALDSGLNVAGR